MVFLTRAVDLQRVYGLVSNGMFIASSTEGFVNNLFIAALQPSTPINTGTFNQNYTVTYTKSDQSGNSDLGSDPRCQLFSSDPMAQAPWAAL